MPPSEIMSLKANLVDQKCSRSLGSWLMEYHICPGVPVCRLCEKGVNFFVSVTVIKVFLSFTTQLNLNFCLLSKRDLGYEPAALLSAQREANGRISAQ